MKIRAAFGIAFKTKSPLTGAKFLKTDLPEFIKYPVRNNYPFPPQSPSNSLFIIYIE